MQYKFVDRSNGWLFRQVGQQNISIGILTVCNTLISVCAVSSALLLRNVIDAATLANRKEFVMQAGIFGSILLLQIFLRAVIRYLEEKTKATIENRLKMNSYHQLMMSDYEVLTTWHTGELMNRLTSDTRIIAENMTSVIPGVISMAVKILCGVILLGTLDLRFLSLFLVGGITMIFVTYLFRKRMKRLHQKVQQSDGIVRSFLQETLESILILRAFRTEDGALTTAGEKMNLHKAARMKRIYMSAVCNLGFGTLMNGAYFVGLLWCGVKLLHGMMTFGTLSAMLQLINQIQQPFANVSGYLPKYYALLASADRLMEFEQLPKEKTSEQTSSVYENLEGMEAKCLTFCYLNQAEAVLKNAEFQIRKGEFVAILGGSGEGKSTLLRLLLAVLKPSEDTKLHLLWSDASRSPVSEETRTLFAYVPQENLLLSGTIEEVVDCKHPSGRLFTEEERRRIRMACKVACADEFISELPNQYGTQLGEHGLGLSEGQMQRLAIARAIYYGAPILLLDEATSALDEETERQVLLNLKQLTQKTVLIVTHRKAALKLCNCRLIIQNKKIYTERTDHLSAGGGK